jgi:hypothetical protein
MTWPAIVYYSEWQALQRIADLSATIGIAPVNDTL